ncbi:hypothetical protein GXM_03733 [Nostoc sphaeroides CCNUC1]|uniref:Uncharacterized protein n=1 Tax=Nostoc sphaeroides CCNUC1 TaxID=2653204 RepID=A0A5P8W0P0_9NOSO|nr:hypothetical protein GXM_03733 [Nostoc sphaeroides CCNUC1]
MVYLSGQFYFQKTVKTIRNSQFAITILQRGFRPRPKTGYAS